MFGGMITTPFGRPKISTNAAQSLRAISQFTNAVSAISYSGDSTSRTTNAARGSDRPPNRLASPRIGPQLPSPIPIRESSL